jgi:hypothetical protein
MVTGRLEHALQRLPGLGDGIRIAKAPLPGQTRRNALVGSTNRLDVAEEPGFELLYDSRFTTWKRPCQSRDEMVAKPACCAISSS